MRRTNKMVKVIKRVELRNKSREGTYLYIKGENQPPRYYKLKGQYGEKKKILEHYKETYENKTKEKKFKHKKTKKTKNKKQTRKERITVKSSGKIEQNIIKGTSKIKILDLNNKGVKTLKDKKKELIRPLLRKPELLNKFITHQTQNKIKFRYVHEIEIITKDGNKPIKLKIYNKTIDQVKKEIKEEFQTNTYTDKDSRYSKVRRLKSKGYQIIKNEGFGHIQQVNLTTTMRKG